MTGGEISLLHDVITFGYMKAKSDYEITSHDFGENDVMTAISKRDLEKLEKAKRIIDKMWVDYLETLEVIDLDAG